MKVIFLLGLGAWLGIRIYRAWQHRVISRGADWELRYRPHTMSKRTSSDKSQQ